MMHSAQEYLNFYHFDNNYLFNCTPRLNLLKSVKIAKKSRGKGLLSTNAKLHCKTKFEFLIALGEKEKKKVNQSMTYNFR